MNFSDDNIKKINSEIKLFSAKGILYNFSDFVRTCISYSKIIDKVLIKYSPTIKDVVKYKYKNKHSVYISKKLLSNIKNKANDLKLNFKLSAYIRYCISSPTTLDMYRKLKLVD